MLHEQKPSLEEAIEHYGVKGMKWGVRKDGSSRISPEAKAKIKKGAAIAGIVVATGVTVAVARNASAARAGRKAIYKTLDTPFKYRLGPDQPWLTTPLKTTTSEAFKGLRIVNPSTASPEVARAFTKWVDMTRPRP